MNQTYFMAHSVSAWLGLPPSTQQLVPLSTSIEEHEEADAAEGEEAGAIDGQETPTMDWDAHMADLTSRPYWSRRWIIQEFTAGAGVQVYCGSVSLHWVDFRSRAQVRGARSRRGTAFAAILMQQRHSRSLHGKPTLLDLLTTYGQAACKDPRDRVFALLALAEDGDLVCDRFPDYTLSEREVLILTLAYFQKTCPGARIGAGSDIVFEGLGVAAMPSDCRESLLAEVERSLK